MSALPDTPASAREAVPDLGTLAARARDCVRREGDWPLPGRGRTLARWQALAAIAARDLALVKVVEAHYDALAILADLDGEPTSPDALLAVWAAEGPQSTVVLDDGRDGPRLTGRKPWCSGAGFVDAALLTVQVGGVSQLVRVDMRGPGVERPPSVWQAVGMAAIESGPVEFHHVPCTRVGAPGAYLERPGFWHGGAGIAACWYGAAAEIARHMADPERIARDPHAAALLGRVDMALGAAAALLRELAARIDTAPSLPHQREVVRVRSLVERACHEVLDAAGRAMGPGPLCGDRQHAQRCADLSVFVRQCHADRDWAALGLAVASLEEGARWPL